MTEPAPRRPPRILVVDDDPGVSEVLCETLSAAGYEVEAAADGRIALDRLAHAAYDAILSDVQMPELDGMELYRTIETRYPHMAPRFIMVTGSSLTREARDFLKEVRIEVIAKPFDLATIRRTVQRILAGG